MKKTIVRRGAAFAASLACCLTAAVSIAAPTGGFLAILNENSSFADNRRSIGFYDVDELDAGPLFSVFIGYERPGNFRELSAITSDPLTGDVYLVGYDSGTAGNVDTVGAGPEDDDTEGDYDLYKIDFQSLYTHWETNFQGTDARTSGLVDQFSPSPTVPNSATAADMMDYVTYAAPSSDPNFTHDGSHSNAVVLASAISKIGEINRNQNPDFPPTFQVDLEYMSDGRLLLLDDSNEAEADDNAANDHAFRLLSRVSTSPGAATSNNDEGGYNNTTTESWESTRIALVDMDGGFGHSEPQDSAYYLDPVTGVRGAWVMERDGGGDDVAFLELDASGSSLGYRQFTNGSTAFALDNDPFVDPATNDGFGDKIFVDADTGDLILIESSFGDTPATEPGVIRREVVSYDNGGQIQFGAWGEKVLLNPVKDPASEAGVFYERGYFSAYDSENDQVYFYAPGNSPDFQMEIYVLDLATGTTTSYLDVDDSVSLFTSGVAIGDKGTFFFLGGGGEFDVADFDQDGDVDGDDLIAWSGGYGSDDGGDTDGDSDTDGVDFLTWQQNFTGPAPAGGSVPEPTALGLAALVVGAALVGRRRR